MDVYSFSKLFYVKQITNEENNIAEEMLQS